MKMKKLVRAAGAGITAAVVALSLTVSGIRSEAAPSYLKAATYVSDAWVSNFWNSESDHMDEELAQIAADGFNSIVLVVPWREFQPGGLPVSYNRYAFQKLDKVMNAANAHGLMVELRVGYVWDYYNDDVVTGRFRDLLKDPSTRAAWLAYAKQIYRTASAHSNFYGGFMTWEDFWNYVEDAANLGKGANSRNAAKECGYQTWLKKHYSLKQVNEYYQPAEKFTSYDNVYIPARKEYAYKLFYEFYDDFLNDLLEDTQKVFPNLSMEVRLDVDPVDAQDGNGQVGASHYGTFPCADAGYTSLMYSVSMGHGFGDVLSTQEAIKTMNEQLSLVRANNGGKPVFIDQLLYMDATEGFEQNARLAESHRGAFLTGIPDTLRAHTNGYAVWTYRNYTNNPVYNHQFALGTRGWNVTNGSVMERNGSSQLLLQSGGSLAQKVGHRIGGRTTHDGHVRFTADSDEPAVLTVKLGSMSQTVEVNGPKQYDLNLGRKGFYEVSFETDGDVYLDNIHVYNFVQDGQLRDIDGNELSCMGAMRTLNASMN